MTVAALLFVAWAVAEDRPAVATAAPEPPAAVGLEAEPTVEQVLAALLPVNEERPLDDALSRSRWANALPQRLSVRVRRDEALTLDDSTSEDGSWTYKSKDATRLAWEVHAQWSLSELALSRETPRLLALQAERERREAARRERVIRLYYQRRKAQLLFLATRDPLKRAALWADIGELAAHLNDATGGALRFGAVRWWAPAAP